MADPSRPRYQFSLRALFAAVTAAAVVCGAATYSPLLGIVLGSFAASGFLFIVGKRQAGALVFIMHSLATFFAIVLAVWFGGFLVDRFLAVLSCTRPRG